MDWVDLNADVGEECGDDAALFAIVTSANVAAGGHAGGGEVLADTVRLAVAHGVAVGAHPSYPDRAGFGRASLLDDHGHEGIRGFVAEQVALVAAECRRQGTSITHVKAHGALYADAGVDRQVAEAFLGGVSDAAAPGMDADVVLVGPSGSALERACQEAGWGFLSEMFADRAYSATGTLVPRSQPGSVLLDVELVAERAVRMVTDGEVLAADGSVVRIQGGTLCLHGDTPGAVVMARRVRDALEAAGISVTRHDHARRAPRGDGAGS